VFRAKTQAANFIAAFVIISKSITTGLSGFRIEPAHRHNATYRLDPHHGCPTALIGNYNSLQAGLFQMIAIAFAGYVVGVDAVMRQVADRVQLTRPQFVDVIR